MGLTDAEAAQLAALTAKAVESDDDTEDVVDAAGDVAADVGAAVAGAVGTAAAAVAEAVADQVPPPAEVVIEAPDPVAVAEADAIRIKAQADAEVQVLDARVGGEIALADVYHEHAKDEPDETGNLLDQTLGPIVGELAPETSDSSPKDRHWWFR